MRSCTRQFWICRVEAAHRNRKKNNAVVATHSYHVRLRRCRCTGRVIRRILDQDWPRLRAVRAMSALGVADVSCCGAVCAREQGRLSMVASLVVRFPIRDLFLHRTERVKSTEGGRVGLAGGPPFYTTETNTVEFPGGASFLIFVGRSFSSDIKSMPRSGIPFAAPFPRVFEFRKPHRARSAPAPSARRTNRCIARREITARSRHQKLYQTCPVQSVQVLANFVQLVLALHQICSSAQLLSPRLRATFERKPKHETAPKIASCNPIPQPGTAAPIFFPRAMANSNR